MGVCFFVSPKMIVYASTPLHNQKNLVAIRQSMVFESLRIHFAPTIRSLVNVLRLQLKVTNYLWLQQFLWHPQFKVSKMLGYNDLII